MILSDQLKEVKRLDQIRMKNEQMVPREELQGKYREPYEKLLNHLSNQNKKAVAYCRQVFGRAIECLERGMGTYNPDELYEMMREYYEPGSGDPFEAGVLKAVYEALEDRDREDDGGYAVSHEISKRGMCGYCGKKEATQLCDMPKHTIAVGIRRSYVKTCDNPMCPDCATRFRGFELCPDCVKELEVSLRQEEENQ